MFFLRQQLRYARRRFDGLGPAMQLRAGTARQKIFDGFGHFRSDAEYDFRFDHRQACGNAPIPGWILFEQLQSLERRAAEFSGKMLRHIGGERILFLDVF